MGGLKNYLKNRKKEYTFFEGNLLWNPKAWIKYTCYIEIIFTFSYAE